MTSSCRQIIPLLEAFGDEELAPEQLLEVEQHLVDCSTCAERVRLNHVLHRSVRSAVRTFSRVFSSTLFMRSSESCVAAICFALSASPLSPCTISS